MCISAVGFVFSLLRSAAAACCCVLSAECCVLSATACCVLCAAFCLTPRLHDRFAVSITARVLARCSSPVRQLLALLFGIWFRMIYHTDVNTMSVEAVAKSVAGSIFHTCRDHPSKVEKASKVCFNPISSPSYTLFNSIAFFVTTYNSRTCSLIIIIMCLFQY